MTNRYQTSRITASRVTPGMVLYHGGTVDEVFRMADGRIVITANGRDWIEAPNRRLTYYPNLGR